MREVQVVACALLNVSTPQKTQAASSLSLLEDSGSGDAPRSESVGHVAIKQSNEEGFRLRLFLPACQRYTASVIDCVSIRPVHQLSTSSVKSGPSMKQHLHKWLWRKGIATVSQLHNEQQMHLEILDDIDGSGNFR